MAILSKNKKTEVSLNLPRSNCRPTTICSFCCYGRHHYIGHGPAPLAKWNRNSDYLTQTPDCKELIDEACVFTSVRIAGVGDLLPSHVRNLLILARKCPDTQFWGMTRKPELARKLNNKFPNLHLLVTADASSPDKVWDYEGRMCFGPRRAQDHVPRDRRIVTVFPYHNSGKVVNHVPEHRLDCPAIRHKVSGCLDCGRCWKWKPL
jgi:hypothetical protein